MAITLIKDCSIRRDVIMDTMILNQIKELDKQLVSCEEQSKTLRDRIFKLKSQFIISSGILKDTVWKLDYNWLECENVDLIQKFLKKAELATSHIILCEPRPNSINGIRKYTIDLEYNSHNDYDGALSKFLKNLGAKIIYNKEDLEERIADLQSKLNALD